MQLSDYSNTKQPRSVVDGLPQDVRDQLCEARRVRSHSVREMVEWLRLEGYDFVSASALTQWFYRQGVRAEVD